MKVESRITGVFVSSQIAMIDCFENAQLKGTVFAGGVTSTGEIEGHPALQKAYEMGKGITRSSYS